MTLKLSIVVPVYQSQTILGEFIEQVQAAVSELGLFDKFELLLVNDASPDGSWLAITEFAKEYRFIRGISLRKNFGQHSATMAGLNYAQGEVIVIMDDDLQHPPSEIGNLLREIQTGADVCYARYIGRQHKLWKVLGSRFNDWAATLLLGKPKGLYLSSFKAISKDVVYEIIKYDGPYAYVDGLILDVTRSINVIEIDHMPRHHGVSNYGLKKSVSLWLRMATSFSVFPLRIVTILGFSLSLLSLITIIVVSIQKFLNPEVPLGWTSLIATILFVGGVQTFCIGMLGEYLGRTYLKINGKPQYVIRETTWAEK